MGFNGDTMGNVMIYSIKHVYLVVLELENQHVQKGKQCYILFHITGCILQNYVRLAKGTASLSYMQKKHIYLSIHPSTLSAGRHRPTGPSNQIGIVRKQLGK